MSDSLNQKIAIGLRQIAKEVDDLVSAYAPHLDCEAVDRINGFAAELEAEVASGEGVAGTHAYDMLAVAAEREVTTTEALIHLVAATVLMQVGKTMGGVPERGMAVGFSPLDMDAMHKDYDMTATHDGLLTTVRIIPRPTPALGLKSEPGPDDSPAKGQAPAHTYDKPYWFARIGPERIRADSRALAEQVIRRSLAIDDTVVAEVENRMCPREDCPNPDTQGSCARCAVV